MKQYLLAVATALACLALHGAQAQNASQDVTYREAKVREHAFVKTPIPTWVTPTPLADSKLTGPVVTRLSETHFLAEQTPQVFIHKVMQLNSASVLQEFGQMPLEFAPDYQTLSLHWLRIIRNGNAIDKRDTAQVRFLQREMGLEQGIYSGTVTASILIEDLRVGDMVEVAYTITGANPVFGKKYFDAANWGQQYPTELRRVVFQHPASRDIRYKLISSNAATQAPHPARSRQGDMIRLTFDHHQPTAITLENGIPESHDPVGWIQFSEFSSWNEVATWATTLFSDAVPMTGEFAQQIAQLQAEPGTEQKIVKALQYVQNEIRYFSVSLGESSHRPAPPNVTMQRRFGDCKDKSVLLVSLLRKLGIRADPVLVAAQRRHNLEVLLPSPTAFDHMIVRVQHDGKYYFLDPTRIGQAGRLETMGQTFVGHEVLVVTPQTTALSVIPNTQTLADKPSSILNEIMVVTDFEKPATLEGHTILTGRDAEYTRHISRRYPEQYTKSMVNEITRRYPGARLVGELEFKDTPEENRLEIIERYTIDKPAELDRGVWYVNFTPSNMVGMLKRPDSPERSAPLHLSSYPLHVKYSFDLELPENVSAMIDPRSQEVSNNTFSFRMNESFRGNQARIDMDLRTFRPMVLQSDMKDYVKDLRETNTQIRGYVGTPVSWIRERTATATPAAADSNSLATRLRTGLEDEIAAYTRVIKGGKLGGKDLARVYFDRALAYSNSEQNTAAIADMQEAIKLDGSNPEIRLETGTVHRKRGEYQSSLEQLDKALSLGASPESVYRSRGTTYYHMGKYDNALTEFERVVLSPRPSDIKTYTTLWYLWTLGHAGKPVPPSLKTRLGRELEGQWPRPAYGLFIGAATPEQVLQSVDLLQGDARQMALCEAYYYIGQYYLLQKNTAKAAEYFVKTRATRITNYTEYSEAGNELARMKNK